MSHFGEKHLPTPDRVHEYNKAKELLDTMMNEFPKCGTPEDYASFNAKLRRLVYSNIDENSIWDFALLAGELRDSARGRFNSQKRLKNDPKQLEKFAVYECWQLWRKAPERYKSKAAFARDMLSKFESLESQRVIERWCLEWESESS